jgi:hypothetical protein
MSQVDKIRTELWENRLLENGWIIVEPNCDDDRLVLSGHGNDNEYRIRILEQEDENLTIEATDGDYSSNGYFDSNLLLNETVENPDEVIPVLAHIMSEIDLMEPPYSLETTLNVLVSCGAILITVEPRILNTGLLVSTHISGNTAEYRTVGEQLGGVVVDGTELGLDLELSQDLSPGLNQVIAYARVGTRGIPTRNTQIGSEKVEDAVNTANQTTGL